MNKRLPEYVSVAFAAEFLGGKQFEPELLDRVRYGDLPCLSHSPVAGPLTQIESRELGVTIVLPRLTDLTDPNTVLVEMSEIHFTKSKYDEHDSIEVVVDANAPVDYESADELIHRIAYCPLAREFHDLVNQLAPRSRMPVHMRSWREAFGISELEHLPAWRWRGWPASLSIQMVACIQWPERPSKQAAERRALLDAYIEGEVAAKPFPGVQWIGGGFIAADLDGDLPAPISEDAAARAHRLTASEFRHWLGAVGTKPSPHVTAWFAASDIGSTPGEMQAQDSTPRPSNGCVAVDIWRGTPFAGKSAKDVVEFSDSDLTKALEYEHIQKKSVRELIRILILRIAEENNSLVNPGPKVVAKYLEDHCHSVVFVHANDEGENDCQWRWFPGGLPPKNMVGREHEVLSDPLNWDSLRGAVGEEWGAIALGSRRSKKKRCASAA